MMLEPEQLFMKRHALSKLAISLPFAGILLLSGCATTKNQQLYYWGDYQPQVYGHFTKEKGPEEQIANLEAGLEKARSLGKPVPPGYNAHLGILYAQGEHQDQMIKYFNAEKELYPEGTAYMDFLMRKFKQTQ